MKTLMESTLVIPPAHLKVLHAVMEGNRTLRKISARLGWTSTNAAHECVVRLLAAGLIKAEFRSDGRLETSTLVPACKYIPMRKPC